MTTMKAARIHAYGDLNQLVVEDVPAPTIKDNELLIRVHAASVNPFDWKVRQGYLASMLSYEMPLILGWDFSGVVEATGISVTDFGVGDEVFGRGDITRNGTYAEYTAVAASEVVCKPTEMEHTEAASIPHAALAAWRALEVSKLSAGQKILIHAAAGGVGTFAVQLAKHMGAYVIGTASSGNLEFLKELGADEVIDYTTTRFEDVVRDVDVVIDTMGGDTLARSWKLLKRGGFLASLVEMPSSEMAASHGVSAQLVTADMNTAALEQIKEMIQNGTLKLVIMAVFPLDDVRQAQALSQSMHSRGKIIVKVADTPAGS